MKFDWIGCVAGTAAIAIVVFLLFLPPIVGASDLPYRRFLLWNVVGGVAWAVSLSLAGFWLGKIPAVANNIELIAVGVALVSFLPVGIGILRRRLRRSSSAGSPAAPEPEPTPK